MNIVNFIPVYKEPVYFISDNHFKLKINTAEKDRRSRLYFVFNKIKKTGGTLVIGGDFFDFWFNYNYVVPSGYIDLLYELKKLSSAKIDIHFILGNHDYWDFGYFKKQFNAIIYKNNMEFNINNSLVQVCHGDGLLKKDRSYRFMKKIIRSKLCIFLFKNFHADWGCWLAQKISKTSSIYHHHDDNNDLIKNEILNYARLQWYNGVQVVLIGHYHQKGIIEENGKKLIFMGDWLRHFTITRFSNNTWWQGNWDEL